MVRATHESTHAIFILHGKFVFKHFSSLGKASCEGNIIVFFSAPSDHIYSEKKTVCFYSNEKKKSEESFFDEERIRNVGKE